MLRKWSGRWSASQRGQSLVEAAITIPLLILMLGTAVDVIRVFQTYMVLTNAAREGARYYSRAACLSTSADRLLLRANIIDTVVAETADLATPLDEDADIGISPDPAGGCPTTDTSITVSINYRRFRTWLATLTPAGSWNLHTHTTMIYTGQTVASP